VNDPRPDELLAHCARVALRLGLPLAWTNSLAGNGAKACSRSGAANWKRATPLPADEDAAVAYFTTRARKRNPVVPAGAGGLLLVEIDLDVPDDAIPDQEEVEARVAALLDRLGIVLPRTVTVRSRRGLHYYLRLPEGCPPVKVQVDEEKGIAPSRDGYVVSPPALHELPGVVYRYVDDGELAPVPPETYRQLVERGEQTREQAWLDFKAGEPITKGWRNETIFHAALELVRAGKTRADALEELLEINARQCRPPLDDALVRKQVGGAAKWAREHPTDQERLREEARRVLHDRRAGDGRRDESTGTAGGWEEPVPIATREAVPALELALLPDWVARWAAAITAEKGAALDLGGNLALGVISGGIARNVQVSPRPGWYEPTNLYEIVALAPGQAKSPVFKSALRPVRTLERQLMQHWAEHERLVTLSSAIFEKRRKDLVSEAASDDELEPERLREMMDELDAGLGSTEAEPQPRLLTEDCTPEALAALLAAHGRVIAASDEGSALFENLAGRYARGSVSWDLFNKAHSGTDVAIDRKSSGSVIVYDPSLVLALATQPEMLRTLAGKPGAGGRGVLARPLYSMPAPVYSEGVTRAADPGVLDEYERRIRDVYNDTPELETDEDDHPRPTTLTFDALARERFERFEEEVNRERRELGGDDVDGESVYLGWLSKLAGQTARLAAVLHCAAKWTGGFGASALVIDEATVERAIALARYYRAHALSVFGLMGELPMQALAVRVLRWLSTRDEGERDTLTVRDVHRSRGAGTTASQVRVALRLLEEHGYVRLARTPAGPGGGRPSERVQVNPQIWNHTKSSDRGDKTEVLSPLSGDFQGSPFCVEHPDAGRWLARDRRWRCRECEPPAFPGEVIEERAC
jgi:replicative DNA helicase